MSSAYYYISLVSKATAGRCQVARRPISRRVIAAGSNSITAARRPFASSSSSGGGGGGGRKTGGGGGSGGDKNNKHNKKDNFDEKVLRPASRGELSGKKKHDSGIPRLVARKHKAKLDPHHVRGSPRFMVHKDEDIDEQDDQLEELLFDEEDAEAAEQAAMMRMRGGVDGGGSRETTAAGMVRDEFDFDLLSSGNVTDYYAEELLSNDDYENKYYWREEEYESLTGAVSASDGDNIIDFEDLKDEDGLIELDYGEEDVTAGAFGTDIYDRDDGGDYFDVEGDGMDEVDDRNYHRRRRQQQQQQQGSRFNSWETKDPEMQFFYDQNNIIDIASMDFDQQQKSSKAAGAAAAAAAQESLQNMVLPLRDHGPDLDDFLEAMQEHPSKYAHVARYYRHPESLREPKPVYSAARGGGGGAGNRVSRNNPPMEFIESFARFLYVSGLPPFDVNGEPNDIENPIHRDLLQKTIAKLVGVDSEHVFATDASSAFVGFKSPLALATALRRGPSESIVALPPSVSMHRSDPEDSSDDGGGVADFVNCSPEEDSVVELTNIPPGNTAQSLIRQLFPEGSEVQTVYGDLLSQNDFYFKSNTSVLIRFASSEQAMSAVDSVLLGEQLNLLGQYQVRYFRARRELVHAGFDGPARTEEKRVMGPRLIVDGEMPSKQFYISHSRVIHVRNLDTTLSKEDITNAFQPYCTRRRDIYGSIEFVTCEAGIPTGCAYVGFDTVGEAEAAIRSLNGTILLGDRRASLRLVKDRVIPGRPLVRPEGRPERSVEELLDDLDNWEKYVDPEDMKLLEKAGISKIVLDEALRNIRYRNATFGPLDSGIRNESIEPDKARGEKYKELVEMYISTLKECLPTRDNVGEMYEAVHFPDEPIDLSIFEREEERQKQLLEKRANP